MASKTVPVVTSVTITPNPVAVGMTFKVAAVVGVKELVEVVEPKLIFPFPDRADGMINMGEITYVDPDA